MDRVFNQEIKLTLKPKEIDKNLFMKQANEIERKIKQIIYEKFNTTVNIDSRMKFGIDYFLEKFKEDKNFSFVKYGDGELLCMIGAKGEKDQHCERGNKRFKTTAANTAAQMMVKTKRL